MTYSISDCGGGYTTVCICQNSLNCTLKRENFIVGKLNLKKPDKKKTKLKDLIILKVGSTLEVKEIYTDKYVRFTFSYDTL